MKRIFSIVLTLLTLVATASAQSSFNNAAYAAATSGGSYKGFLEAGYLAGFGDYKANMLEILTTHGAAFTPNFFIGAGLGATVLFTKDNITWWDKYPQGNHESQPGTTAVMIPLYADLRYTFGNGGIQPFLECKIGASLLVSSSYIAVGDRYIDDDASMYISPTIGFRFPLGTKSAINLGVTYTLISQRLYYYNEYNFGVNDSGGIINAVGARLQIEW